MIIGKIVVGRSGVNRHIVSGDVSACSKFDVLQAVGEEVEHLFAKYADELKVLKVHAGEVSSAVETAGFFIERHTSVVCPECRDVCCINRHSYHEFTDVVCICALGERLPAHNKEAVETGPCQFLGEKGCTLGRPLRPHRCNWYFCTSLLEHIQTVPARSYRGFIDDLRQINRNRETLVASFVDVVEAAGYDSESLRQILHEIFLRK